MRESWQESGVGGSGQVVARLRALIGQPSVTDAYIRFRLDLFAAQEAARCALAETTLATGPVPVGPGDVPFPAPVLATLFEAIRASAAAHGHETNDIRRLSEAVAASSDLLSAIVAAAAFGPDLAALESLARRHAVYVDALLFVGRALAAPCVSHAVRTRVPATALTLEAAPHRCPRCASPPSVARLRREDGGRMLTCGLCGSEWAAVRVACACCGMSEAGLLGVLRVNDGDARWIDTCEGCKGYIKTVDERRLPEGEIILPIVEESATLHLDLLAEREGYIRRLPYVLAG